MPQIWMTYGELADLLGCGLDQVRERVQRDGLDRRKSRDGKTRVKLSLELAGLFSAKLKGEPQPHALDQAIDSMRQLYVAMARYENGQAPQPATHQDRPGGDDSGECAALTG